MKYHQLNEFILTAYFSDGEKCLKNLSLDSWRKGNIVKIDLCKWMKQLWVLKE